MWKVIIAVCLSTLKTVEWVLEVLGSKAKHSTCVGVFRCQSVGVLCHVIGGSLSVKKATPFVCR